jgi:protein arginine kinase activator
MSDECPLTGKPCDKEKNIKGMKTVNGETTKFSICSDCASESTNQWKNFLETIFHGMHISQMFNPTEMEQILGSIKGYDDLNHFIETVVNKPTIHKNHVNKKCESCGTTLEELFKSGRLGCKDCYTNLQPFVDQIIFKSQGNKQHKGKRPKNVYPKNEDTIEILEEKMKLAIQEERYEDASILRDNIKEKKKHP